MEDPGFDSARDRGCAGDAVLGWAQQRGWGARGGRRWMVKRSRKERTGLGREVVRPRSRREWGGGVGAAGTAATAEPHALAWAQGLWAVLECSWLEARHSRP